MAWTDASKSKVQFWSILFVLNVDATSRWCGWTRFPETAAALPQPRFGLPWGYPSGGGSPSGPDETAGFLQLVLGLMRLVCIKAGQGRTKPNDLVFFELSAWTWSKSTASAWQATPTIPSLTYLSLECWTSPLIAPSLNRGIVFWVPWLV